MYYFSTKATNLLFSGRGNRLLKTRKVSGREVGFRKKNAPDKKVAGASILENMNVS
jgi:hypothetical protein